MRNTALLLIIAAAISLSVQAEEAPANEARTLHGEFHWTGRDSRGDLEAVGLGAGRRGVLLVASAARYIGKPAAVILEREQKEAKASGQRLVAGLSHPLQPPLDVTEPGDVDRLRSRQAHGAPSGRQPTRRTNS